MRRLYQNVLILFFLSIFSLTVASYIDFDISMQTESFSSNIAATRRVIGISGIELLAKFKDLYQKNIHFLPDSAIHIPKIIHQIWLGGPVPDALKEYMETWKVFHPDWRYILWTDELVEHFPLYNKELYDNEQNYGAKSDILRYEILFHFGGVYVDTDFECLRALDSLHHTYDFYTGLISLDAHFVHVGIGIVGSKPQHPIIAFCIVNMKNNYENNVGAPAKTGPIPFTRACFYYAGMDFSHDIIFPATYFYPFPARGVYQKDGGLGLIDRHKWISEGAYAVHWWGKTWMPKEYRPGIFRSIDNQEGTKNWDA